MPEAIVILNTEEKIVFKNENVLNLFSINKNEEAMIVSY